MVKKDIPVNADMKESAEKSEQVKETTQKKSKPKASARTVKKQKTAKKDDTKSKISSFEEKIRELQDRYLRLSAEFDNYRKRTLKEKMELTKSAGESLLMNLLPVMDDLERGIQTVNDAEDIEAIKEGINLIYNKFRDFLNQNGIKEIEALNKEFNIDFHEAVTKIPVPKKDMKGKVVDVIEKGYTLNEKVIRYSKVVIGE
jgi:molecular chaperone GrpE